MEPICYTPIGLIHSPFTEMAGTPLHSVAAQGVQGSVELDPAYAPGLQDIAGFEYLILIYHLHLGQGGSLVVTPFMDDQPHGVFATRAPRRPNALGISVVRLIGVDGPTLIIEEVDVLDGTPLLDIKPYVPAFDARETDRVGWYGANLHKLYTHRADDRFHPDVKNGENK